MLSLKTEEQKLRRKLNKVGYTLCKSRIKNVNPDNLGGYMITDTNENFVVRGSRYELDIEDVKSFCNAL